ncbi:hypothetical protein ScPMuIL_008282 [Solemya velum]
MQMKTEDSGHQGNDRNILLYKCSWRVCLSTGCADTSCCAWALSAAEDIDFSPMEVVSVLMPLLENQTLFVPGHGDNIKAAPDICMFATQRQNTFALNISHRYSSHQKVLCWLSIHACKKSGISQFQQEPKHVLLHSAVMLHLGEGGCMCSQD